MKENKQYGPDYKEQLHQAGYSAMCVLVIGGVELVLYQQKHSGKLIADQVSNYINPLSFKKSVEEISQKAVTKIENVDSEQVALAQLSLNSIDIKKFEKIGKSEEITTTLQVESITDFDKKEVILQEQELSDLFFATDLTKAKASFIFVDTAQQELVGFVLRRPQPVLVFIPAVEVLGKLSSTLGVTSFFEHIYHALRVGADDFETVVDGKVFDAMLPSKGRVVFQTTNQQFEQLLKRLYQTRMLLLAQKAPNDQAVYTQLLSEAPFLEQDKTTGGFSLFGKKKQESVTTIDESMWFSRVSPLETGVITTPFIRSPKKSSQSLNVISQLAEKPKKKEVKKDEKQEALLLVARLEQEVRQTLETFKNYKIIEINTASLKVLQQRLDAILKEAERYAAVRPRKKPPVTQTTSMIRPRSNSIGLAGIDSEHLYSFLDDGVIDAEYRTKINGICQEWDEVIRPLYQLTSSRTERFLAHITKNPTLMQQKREEMRRLVAGVLKLVSAQTTVEERQIVNTGEVAHITLVLKVLFVLQSHLEALKAKGQAEEIDNWVVYTYSITVRLLGQIKFILGGKR